MESDFSDDLLKAVKLWSDFEHELIHKNRYFPKNEEVLTKITDIAKATSIVIDQGNIFYRAREYEPIDLSNYHNVSDSPSDDESVIANKKHKTLYSCLLLAARGNDTKFATSNMFSQIIKEMENTGLWGFNEKESGVPPFDKAGVNRASPKYIPYLYLANNINTALAEIRAQVDQPISVAFYETSRSITVVDLSLTNRYIDNDSCSTIEDVWMCISIQKAFSSPSRSNEKDYIVSQYIAEYIKTMGYDGITFNSARNRGGINYTLFDDSACKFLRSEIHEVKNIEFKSKRLLPP